MKVINETFEDEEFKRLLILKGKRTWRNFIIQTSESEAKRKEPKEKEEAFV